MYLRDHEELSNAKRSGSQWATRSPLAKNEDFQMKNQASFSENRLNFPYFAKILRSKPIQKLWQFVVMGSPRNYDQHHCCPS